MDELHTDDGVPIADLSGMPDDIDKRMKTKPVKLLAESLKSVGLLERIKVRKSDMRIVSGRDRIAAHLLNDETEIGVQFVECSDVQLVEADLISNAARRHSPRERDEAIVALTELYTAEEAAQPLPSEASGPGRPPTAKGNAERRVASATGKTVQSIRKAAKRLEKANAPTVVKPKERKKKETIISLGRPLDEPFSAQCDAVTAFIKEAVSKVTSAQAGITKLLNSEIQCYVGDLERVREELHRQASELKSLKPHSVCPYCKNVQGFVKDCDACEGKGWVGSRGYDAVPHNLLVEGDDAIIVDGDGAEWGVAEAIAEGEDWLPE